MLQNDKLSALIIGAGRIGSGFDSPESEDILTHAHGYRACAATELVGFFDVDEAAARTASAQWNTEAFASLEAAAERQIDMVSICTQDATHYDVLKLVLPLRPKAVICEKPLTLSLEKSKEIADVYREHAIALQINYSRRFDPTVLAVRQALQDQVYGAVISGYGIYTKGLLHNGSHLIDLARVLLGEVLHAMPVHRSTGGAAEDPTVSAFLRFERCPAFHLAVGDAEAYAIFELVLVCEKARLTFTNSGFQLCVESVQADPRYAGYRSLAERHCTKTGLNSALLHMIENTVDHIRSGRPLLCAARDATSTQAVCDALRQIS